MADVLELLRPLMDSHSPPLHALVVPSEDYHQVCVAHYLHCQSTSSYLECSGQLLLCCRVIVVPVRASK